ncbi:phosphotriesterase [Streptomyces sp. WMMB 322]|uniref:phosphotriesterase family protein n=1 Tax=Streptomyces sp. WMMB 322 TaxID=1286821 RepID=UPI00082395A0|nr:phosphotriesterase [Streptomyces sp. WMMB 322]SCK33402.1 phosphotriesterase-related protein [Streptomyces sp. WMMB 322]
MPVTSGNEEAGPQPVSAVRTVLGDVPGDRLGVCDAHAHLFLRSPALPGRELDDAAAAEAESVAFADAGGQSAVQWTPYGMGRCTGALAELARRTRLHLIAATGLHQAVHHKPPGCKSAHRTTGRPGQPDPLGAGAAGLAELFVEELTRGVRGSVCGEGPRAGLITVAGGLHGLDAHATRVMHAAAEAHHATGAPVAVHLEGGTAAHEVLDLLCEGQGVPPDRVLLGHVGRLPDPAHHRELARRGAWLVFDGPSRAHRATDARLTECLASLVEHGHGDRIMIGSDITHAEARGAPGMHYLPAVLRPRLARELGPEAAERIFVHNPARALAAEWKDRAVVRLRTHE